MNSVGDTSSSDGRAPYNWSLWQFVTKLGKSSEGGGNQNFTCNICNVTYKGSYSRVKAHLLKLVGSGIKSCPKIIVGKIIEMSKLEGEAIERRECSSKIKMVPLPRSMLSSSQSSFSMSASNPYLFKKDGHEPKKRKRNRSLGRRKSGGVDSADRLERANSYVNDGDRNPLVATKSGPIADHGDSTLRVKLISVHGCCNSDAFQLLNNRWTAAMNAHNSLPEDSAERPVLYTRKSTSTWSQAILPHLLIQPAGGASTGVQRDFLSELRQAIQNANSGPNF
ncbi:hypothetical protein BUALT_Bualt02G0165100 [Buddleja alternifolia]|uniref:BED-type domain-containing protein n=1 Tax=Buddleja alternifolia TaxID=168488 RepID=A0AAV6YBG4_9LAMI|nr:hypothetical protein BUALT_Bualt02G0165100 [Buddleja alternifolia]